MASGTHSGKSVPSDYHHSTDAPLQQLIAQKVLDAACRVLYARTPCWLVGQSRSFGRRESEFVFLNSNQDNIRELCPILSLPMAA